MQLINGENVKYYNLHYATTMSSPDEGYMAWFRVSPESPEEIIYGATIEDTLQAVADRQQLLFSLPYNNNNNYPYQ